MRLERPTSNIQRSTSNGAWAERQGSSSLVFTRLLLVVAFLAAACTTGDSADAGYLVRDSAGIRIVENQAPRGDTTLWQVGEAPLVDIGVLEGDEAYQLFQVGGVVKLSDGRIVVANGGTYELRFFDADGRYLMSAGREGEGPGEFRGVEQVAQVGDSVVAYDWGLSRISVFDLSGQYVRSARVAWQSEGSAAALGAFADGSWLFSTGFSFVPSEISKIVRDTSDYVVLNADGELRSSVGRFPRVEFFVLSTAQQGRATSRVFARTTLHAVAGGQAYIGPNDRYEIFRYTSDGRLDLIVRKEHEHLAVTNADIDAGKAQRLEDASGTWGQTLERMYLDMPMPATMPAFDGLQIDALGNLWVLEYRRPGDDQPRWTVFAPDGHLLGVVETPPGLTIYQIGHNFIAGTWEDEMEVEHVRLYGLAR